MARGSIYAAPVNMGAILRCYSGQVRWRSYTDRVLPVAAASHAASEVRRVPTEEPHVGQTPGPAGLNRCHHLS